MNKLTITGNVGRDAEMRYTPSGVAVCDFSVAVNKRRGKGAAATDETTWVKCTVWRERAESLAPHIKSGIKVMVIGEAKATAYIDKGGKTQASLEITVDEFEFLSSKNESSGGGYSAPQSESESQEEQDFAF